MLAGYVLKNCKPQRARPDRYQNEMGDPEVELEAQAPAQVTTRAFWCVSRQDHAHRIAQLPSQVRRFLYRVHGHLLQNQVRKNVCPMKMHV